MSCGVEFRYSERR